jgi:hypothetical protein
VPAEDSKHAAHRALEDHIRTGDGRASLELRAHAFDNTCLPPPLDGLLGKVATRPTQITDADFAAAQAAGFSQDELIELVICAAVGQAARLYDAGLAALADTAEGRAGNAPCSCAGHDGDATTKPLPEPATTGSEPSPLPDQFVIMCGVRRGPAPRRSRQRPQSCRRRLRRKSLPAARRAQIGYKGRIAGSPMGLRQCQA